MQIDLETTSLDPARGRIFLVAVRRVCRLQGIRRLGRGLLRPDQTDKLAADAAPSDCGHKCHVNVKAKDHIFHPYQKR